MKRLIILFMFLIAGSIAFQSFQCQSREFTTAKVAYQQKDYQKAEEFLQKEIQKNPKNTEAKILLIEVYIKNGKLKPASELLGSGIAKSAQGQKQMLSIQQSTNALWTTAYNKGWEYFNSYNREQDKSLLDSSIDMFNIGIQVRKKIVDFYNFKGKAYELAGDTANAIKSYQKYHEMLGPEIYAANESGIFMTQKRNESIGLLGKPMSSTGETTAKGDSLMIDFFALKGNELVLYSTAEAGKEYKVDYWRYNLPSGWIRQEKMIYMPFSTDPFASLAEIYFNRGDYENSLKYVDIITQLNPMNQDAYSSKIQLYQSLDKMDEALAALKELTEKNPDNKYFWAQYGDIYMTTEDFDKAIDMYEKALKIDPNYDFVLRNLGSAYKNKAALISIEEADKADEQEKYEIKTERYFPLLEKSADYFERALETTEFSNDFGVLSELANIYTVLDKQDKLNNIVKSLEAVEYTIEPAEKESYYLKMIKIYSETNNSEKLKEVQKKLEQLN